MNPDVPNMLNVLTPNGDRTYTCAAYAIDPVTRERTQIGSNQIYRIANEEDHAAHARGELKGRTRAAYNPDDFTFFLLVRVDEK
jgi:hypothetical protein